jgi:hypothetical protein
LRLIIFNIQPTPAANYGSGGLHQCYPSTSSVERQSWRNSGISSNPPSLSSPCGSVVSFLIEKVIKSSALFGRVNTEMELRPFKLAETAELLAGKGLDEILEAQMLTGGIPQYLQLLTEYPSIHLALQDLAFTPQGYFTHEYQRIFTSHFGKNPDFEAIVQPSHVIRLACTARR